MNEDTGSSSNAISTPSTTNNTLTTKEEVASEIKEWMEINQDGTNKTYENAVKHIEFKLGRPLSCLEKTWFEMPYVQTVLQMWLEKCLKKAFEYLDNCNNDISKDMSTDLKLLDSINCFEDIRSKVKDVTLPLRNWCDGECRYLKLVFEQEDLFTNTPRFTVSVNCYLTQFKTSCIEKMFSRCLSDIVKDETNGQKHEKFIIDLNDFLAFVNEDKNVFEKMLLQLGFPQNNEECNGNTGEELVKELVEMFVSCSKNDFLASVRKEEILQAILEKNLMVVENTTDTEWRESFHSLVDNISRSFLQTDGNQTTPSLTLEWFQRYQKASSLMKDVEWTPKLRILTKEMYKKFLLPETEINYKEEGGKKIIFIKGIALFVSKMLQLMKQLKDEHPDVEEIKIVGLKSVHIDCDLDNEIWHGINIGIVTDKLIVDDTTDNNAQTWTGFSWNVSGKNAEDQPMGKPCQAGESGGNVHVVCNEIVNGQKWTIVSDGGDGSDAAYKWTEEKFKNSFPSISSGGKKAMETVLTTLQEILPRENRTRDKDVLPGHKGNFLISGTAIDGSEITAIFYKGKKEGQTLFLIRGGQAGQAGQGGYGGKIEVNIGGESSMTSGSL